MGQAERWAAGKPYKQYVTARSMRLLCVDNVDGARTQVAAKRQRHASLHHGLLSIAF